MRVDPTMHVQFFGSFMRLARGRSRLWGRTGLVRGRGHGFPLLLGSLGLGAVLGGSPLRHDLVVARLALVVVHPALDQLFLNACVTDMQWSTLWRSLDSFYGIRSTL